MRSLCIEISRHCPLWCIHCSADAAPSASSLVNVDALVAAVRRTAPWTELYLSGGEPFAIPQLLRIVRGVRASAERVAIYTSGTLVVDGRSEGVGDDALQAVRAVGIERIEVSAYGATAATHDRVTRRPGSYSAMLETLRRSERAGLAAAVHYVPVSPRSEAEVSRAAGLAFQLGATAFRVLALTPAGRARRLSGRRYSPAFVTSLRLLAQDPRVELSSALRRLCGITSVYERDSWESYFIDSKLVVYPGEGSREPHMVIGYEQLLTKRRLP